MDTLAIYILVLSLWFVSMFVFYKKSQWETGVIKRTEQSEDPKCKAMRRELFTFLEIASKPMAQAADWWSDVIFIKEMFANPKAERLAWAATFALVVHQITSSIWTYLDNHDVKSALLQFFNLRTFVEVYRSGKLGRPVYSLREMRIMEALLESYPQFLFQMFYLLTLSDFFNENPGTLIVQIISIAFSVYSIASVLTYQDIYGLSTRSFFWKLVLILIRVFEVFSRTFSISLAYLYGPRNFIFWFYIVFHPTCLIASLYVYQDLHADQLKEALMATISITLNTSRPMAYILNVYTLVEMIIYLCLLPMWINEAGNLWAYFCIWGCILLAIPLMAIVRFDFDRYKAAVEREIQYLLKSGNRDIVCFLVLRGEVVKLKREEYELSGLQLKEILDSGKYTLSDLRENFGRFVEEIYELDPTLYNGNKLIQAGFVKDDFVKASLWNVLRDLVLQGEVTQLTREECEKSELQTKDLLDSGKFTVSDLRENFGRLVEEIHEVDTTFYNGNKLIQAGFVKDDFVKGSLWNVLRDLVLQGEVTQLTREECEKSGIQAKDLLDSGKFTLSDLRENFGRFAEEIYELDPALYNGNKLIQAGFAKVNFVKGSLMQERMVLNGHTESVNCVTISSDDSFFVSGSFHNLRIWNKDGSEVVTLYGHTSRVTCLAISSDDSFIVSGSFDNSIRIWNKDGSEVATLNGHTHWVSSVAISSDGSFIVSGSLDNTVRIWNQDGSEAVKLNGHTRTVRCVAISSDDSFIVSVSEDNTVRIWNKDGSEVATLHGHTNWVNCVAISSDDSFIVSGSSDNTVRIWNKDGSEVATLKGHKLSVLCIAISSNDFRIISGSDDKSLRIWSSILFNQEM